MESCPGTATAVAAVAAAGHVDHLQCCSQCLGGSSHAKKQCSSHPRDNSWVKKYGG